MRVENNRGIAVARDFRRDQGEPQNGPARTTGTSLVVRSAHGDETGDLYRQPRTLATFVTQLIAKAQDAPHFRERRRADPAEAAEAYRKMLNVSGVPNRYKARPF